MGKFSSNMKMSVLFLISTLKNENFAVKYEEWKPNSKNLKSVFLPRGFKKTKPLNPKATSCWPDSNMQNPAGLTIDLFQGDVPKRELLTALPLRGTKPTVSNSQC